MTARFPKPTLRRATRITAAAFALSAALTGGFVLEADAAETCFGTAPGTDFSWPTSGVFLKNNEILLADPLARKIHHLTSRGEEMLAVGEEGEPGLEVPSEIRLLPNGDFIVEDEKLDRVGIDELVRFNSEFEVVDRIPIKNRLLMGGGSISVLYDWTPWGDGFLAFADIKIGDQWSSAFLYFDNLGNDQVFFSLPTQSEVSYQHTKENHYLAVVDNTGYALVLDSEPYILAFELDGNAAMGSLNQGRRLLPLPENFRHRPSFFGESAWIAERGNPQNQLTAYLELMERSSVALEIHSWNGRLFLLAKERTARAIDEGREAASAQSGGPSEFWLIELNPSSGSELARVKLPVGQNTGHVTLVPGDQHWAVFGTGAVEGLGEGTWNAPYMAQQGSLYLPAEWFNDLSSLEPLATKHGQTTLCPPVGDP